MARFRAIPKEKIPKNQKISIKAAHYHRKHRNLKKFLWISAFIHVISIAYIISQLIKR